MKNQGNRNNVLYVVFHKLSDDTSCFSNERTWNFAIFDNIIVISFLYVCMVNTIYLFSFVETPRKFIIAELSIRKLGSSSALLLLLALMKIRAYGSKALQ